MDTSKIEPVEATPATQDDDWEDLVAAVRPVKRACPINPLERAQCTSCEG